MISIDQYWMGRDVVHRDELTDEIKANAQQLLDKLNRVLTLASQDHVEPGVNTQTGTAVASGWRPKSVNDATANSAKTSNHIGGRAVDLRDVLPARPLARWCLRNQKVLEEVGLWMEDPKWTPSWVHLQSVPPRTGNRVYIPSANPPLVAALPEQLAA